MQASCLNLFFLQVVIGSTLPQLPPSQSLQIISLSVKHREEFEQDPNLIAAELGIQPLDSVEERETCHRNDKKPWYFLPMLAEEDYGNITDRSHSRGEIRDSSFTCAFVFSDTENELDNFMLETMNHRRVMSRNVEITEKHRPVCLQPKVFCSDPPSRTRRSLPVPFPFPSKDWTFTNVYRLDSVFMGSETFKFYKDPYTCFLIFDYSLNTERSDRLNPIRNHMKSVFEKRIFVETKYGEQMCVNTTIFCTILGSNDLDRSDCSAPFYQVFESDGSGSSIEYSILTACQNATFYVVPPPAGVSETWALEVEVDHGTSTTLHDVPNLEQNNNYVTDVSTAATNSPATLQYTCSSHNCDSFVVGYFQ